MMTTAAELIQEVRKIAEERPGFIYSDQPNGTHFLCSYFGRAIGDEAGGPCIVGQALKNLEVPMEGLLEVENAGEDSDISTVLDRGYVDIEYTGSEAMWLAKVQMKQDDGNSWAQAVEEADKWVAL